VGGQPEQAPKPGQTLPRLQQPEQARAQLQEQKLERGQQLTEQMRVRNPVRAPASQPEPLPELHCWPALAVSCSHRQAAGLPGRAEE